jgi:hypothetical protein
MVLGLGQYASVRSEGLVNVTRSIVFVIKYKLPLCQENTHATSGNTLLAGLWNPPRLRGIDPAGLGPGLYGK